METGLAESVRAGSASRQSADSVVDDLQAGDAVRVAGGGAALYTALDAASVTALRGEYDALDTMALKQAYVLDLLYDRRRNAVAPDPVSYYRLVFGIAANVVHRLRSEAATYFEPRDPKVHGLAGSTPHNRPAEAVLDLLREVVQTWTKTRPDAGGASNYLKFIDKECNNLSDLWGKFFLAWETAVDEQRARLSPEELERADADGTGLVMPSKWDMPLTTFKRWAFHVCDEICGTFPPCTLPPGTARRHAA